MLTLSWLWYHKALDRHPNTLRTKAGSIKFTLDIAVVIAYWLLLAQVSGIQGMVGVAAFIYLTYWVWDLLHAFDLARGDYLRHGHASILLGAVHFAMSGIVLVTGSNNIDSPDTFEWIVLVAVITLLFGYRVFKFREFI
ncbi:MAG: hypothetical protein HQ478_01050 [Chloroflexi bacterium]|nr:hypothetical protein [Chloroflexota bacterium]